ncbi:MAG: heavy metal translocating P-type ATPase [Proteobacteria bacterium]|nr:heavy metal translocating P-type ATPase [Pseudomonadota bacterium]
MPDAISSPRAANLAWFALTILCLVAGGLAYLSGAFAFARGVWVAGALPVLMALAVSIVRRLLRRDFGVDVIALLAIGGALLLGEYLAGMVICLMFATGQVLEDYAERRAQREMSALLGRAPRSASRYEGDGLMQVPAEAVAPGDRLLVRGGEVVPVDGYVDSALAVLDESALTGESLPVRRARGELVRGGVINVAAPFDLVARASAADSAYAGIVRLVAAAQRAKAPSTRLADRYALFFVLLTLAAAGAAWAVSGDVVRALAVLVVATPCPLVLAVPIAIIAGMSRCAARGIVVKSGGMLERLAQGRVLFFDKTGTLTSGRARLVALEAAADFDPAEVLRLAASLEQASPHVLAEAIVSFARQRGLRLAVPADIHEEHGAGLVGTIGKRRVAVGSHAYICGHAASADWVDGLRKRMSYEGAAGVFVAIDGKLAGALLLGDEVRLETPHALRQLRKAGIERVVMVTGDHRDVADSIGDALGVDVVLAEQAPADKLAAIEASRRHAVTIMVGDGINDAPALASADVGVAMGARGAAASSEAAGIVLLTDRLDRLAEALAIAQRTRRIALESAVAGMAMSAACMIVAAFGWLAPLAGAIVQEGIDVLVIVNALRALRAPPAAAGTPARLDPADASRLMHEHNELGSILDRIRACADRLPALADAGANIELAEVDALVRERLLAHEEDDERVLYPRLERILGGDDPLAALNRTHREIRRLARLFHRLTRDAQSLPVLPADTVRELQRILYGLDAILRLHFAQEEELYHTLAEVA